MKLALERQAEQLSKGTGAQLRYFILNAALS